MDTDSTPRGGYPIEALGDVAEAMREALAAQAELGYRDDLAVINHTRRILAAKYDPGTAQDQDGTSLGPGRLAAAALEHVAAGDADATLPAELRDLPDHEREELIAEANTVREAAEQATQRHAPDTDDDSETDTTEKEDTMGSDGGVMHNDADELEALAARCEQGAESLTHEAEHAAEVLATRAGGDSADPQEWAQRKQAAAAAARNYAQRLRTEAGSLRQSGGRVVDADVFHEAEKVATAANVGGILIDTSQLDATAKEHTLPSDAAQRQAIDEHAQQKRDAIEGSGLFRHVAEDGQVPYWQLGDRVAAKLQRATEAVTRRQATPAESVDTSSRDAYNERTNGHHMSL